MEPFDLDSLPWLAGADLAAMRRATVRFGDGDRRIELTVSRFGRLTVAFSGVVSANHPGESDSVWRLCRGSESGWLVMGNASGLRIVSTILGVPSPAIHRRMGTTERGILAAAISSVLRAAPDVVFTAARNGDWNGSGLARIDGRVEAETFREAFFLDVPPEWIPAPAPDHLLASMRQRDVRIAVIAEVARTFITAEEWSRAQPGDAVVFEVGGTDEGQALTARIVCGRFAGPAIVHPSGEALLVGEFELDDRKATDGAPNNPGERIVMPNETPRNTMDTVLASAPIEVVAELGRIVLRADEVATLGAGAVLTLGPRHRGCVELRVGDRPWATGELVNVDGQLGVRLTSLAPAGRASTASEADTVRYQR